MEFNNAAQIKAYMYMAHKTNSQPLVEKRARYAIRRLDQKNREVLDRILTGKSVSKDEVKVLGKHLTDLTDPNDKTAKKHSSIVHAIQNIRKKRLSTDNLVKKAGELKPVDIDFVAAAKEKKKKLSK